MNMLNTCIQEQRLWQRLSGSNLNIENRLDRLAALTGRTKAYYLREMVKNGLQDLEDYYLAAATPGTRPQGRRENLHGGRSETRPWPGQLSTPRRP